MKKYILTIIFFSTFVLSFAQQVKVFYNDTSEACHPNDIYLIVEKMPEYKGGLKQLEKELNDSLTFDNKINSKIYLSVYINCEDKAYGFQVLKSINSETDNRIITQLKKMQNWSTGLQRDVKIDCKKTIGIELKKGKILIE